MGYVLGIDLGDTRTSAAVTHRERDSWDDPRPVPLDGDHAGAGFVPSVLYIAADGSVLAGHAAAAQGHTDPQRLACGFVGRVGDSVPVVLPDGPYPPEVLAATLIGWVADEVATREGEAPERITLTHPPSWGAHRCATLTAALEQAGLPGVLLVPSAVAVARVHADRAHLGADSLLGIARLGGRHLDVALVRSCPPGFELVTASRRSQCGPGGRIDDLLVERVLARTGREGAQLPPDVLATLRAECARTKEQLRTAGRAHVPVPAAGGTDRLELDRPEFEQLARPVLRAALLALRQLLAPVPAERLAAVVLAGGAARVPGAGELGRELFGEKTSIDEDPGGVVCRGAAMLGRPGGERAAPARAEPATAALVGQRHAERAIAAYEDVQIGPEPPRPPVTVTTLEPPRRRRFPSRGSRRKARDEEDDQ